MLKMSKMATPPIMDPHTANILICYLLYKIDKPVRVNHLYDIAVGSDIINYFAYQDSIAYLTEHDSVELRRKDDECGRQIERRPGFHNSCRRIIYRNFFRRKRCVDVMQGNAQAFPRLPHFTV